ncbi:hypothetical protein BDV25DRAFT_144810 [Aspergillus avenaceus]|uniref:Zn(2)-C6 fungal-type domain-containing protein n=1 Tax=Aspergillus avenaceus TaxID=36643 RepID=A0A5N6TGC3_ASPAV|nr:hypothetical protein BDV25DRAFT_144810 [Aspergillus avenaceus]
MADEIDLHRPRLGQFLLTWLKVSELRLAKNVLEEQCDRRYETVIQAINNELVNQKGPEELTKGSSWIRRIKCDEQKPACLKCTSTGRRCDGYPTPDYRGKPTSIKAYSIPFKVPGSQADRQLLHYYCCEAAEGLSSYSDPTLWTTLVLQRSSQEPVIRNVLVTFSAIYQDCSSGRFQSRPPLHSLQRIARCHRQLRTYLASPDASAEVVLTCSVIFHACETLLGNTQQAITHLDLGLALLRRCRTDTASSRSDDMIPYLSALFSNLDVQATIFNFKRGSPMLTLVSPEEKSGAVSVVPDTLLSTAHGEAVLLKLQNWMTHYIAKHTESKHLPPEATPADALRERLALDKQFRRFIEQLPESSEDTPTKRMLLLRIQARMWYGILLRCIPSLSVQVVDPDSGPCSHSLCATDHDRSLDCNIDAALADIRSLLDSFHQPSGHAFTLTSQLIAGLYYACTKTNSPRILETAFALLQHPCLPSRDGLWDAGMAASVVRSLLENTVEERPADGSIRGLTESDTPDTAEEVEIGSQDPHQEYGMPMVLQTGKELQNATEIGEDYATYSI